MAVIGISGSYGGLNLGDEAILTCALRELRQAAPDAELVVFSRNADHTQGHHAADRVVAVRDAGRDEIAPEIQRLDLLLLGGGGLLYDKEAHTYLREVEIAHAADVRTATFAISAGPLESPEARRLVARVLNRMNAVTVRDAPAKRLLEEVGVKREIVVTSDPALLLSAKPFDEAMLKAEAVPTDRRLVGISVREVGPAAPNLGTVEYHTLLANAADFIADRLDANLLFVPMERGDIRESHAVIAQMAEAERASVLKGEYGPEEILGLMQHLDMVVAMRLHCLIFAAIARVPFIPLPYSDKVLGFLGDVGLPARTLEEVHAGPLLASIDRCWDERRQVCETLDAHVPPLQARARETAPIALSALSNQIGVVGGPETPDAGTSG
jgi:polysaccharide pyruvyl transferase CsaB